MGFLSAFRPAALLPAEPPLGHDVDGVLRVGEDMQLFAGVGRGLKQTQNSGQLTQVVGALRPAARVPRVLVHVPGPPRGPGLPREEPSAAAVIVMLSSYRHRACLIGTGTRPGSFGQWDEAGAASASCSKIGGGRGRALRRNDEDRDDHEHSQR